MYSNVDVLRNFISNLLLFVKILHVSDRFSRFTSTFHQFLYKLSILLKSLFSFKQLEFDFKDSVKQ